MKKLLIFALVTGITIMVNTVRAQTPATLTDLQGATPSPGPNDISVLDTSDENEPPGLNYYFDNSAPPGQTFTTGSNPNGYILTSLAIVAAGSGGGGITTNSQPYYLRIYSVDTTGTNAILLQTYVSQDFTFFEGDWLQWAGLSIGLAPNTVYAWSFHRGRTGYELLGSDPGSEYTGGQCVLIPANGGGMTFSTTAGYDAMMDIGLTDITNLFVNAPTFSPSDIVTNGTEVTAAAVAFGTGTITYQWQTDGGSGGALTNIPGATSASYNINTSNTTNFSLGAYQYDVIVANGSGTATSAVSQLTIILPTTPANLTDEGDSVLSGPYDISQMIGGGNGDGLNYYDDNGAVSGAYVGQSFTTGTNSQGYYLTSVAVQTGGGGSSDTTTAQGYDLYLFSIENGNATLMAHYTATNFAFTFGDWLEWSGFEIRLKANTMYAYGFGNERTNTSFQSWAALNTSPGTSDLYPGGQICLIPPTGGPLTFGATGLSDAVFDAGLLPIGVGPSPFPFSNPITVSPSATVTVGTQVTFTETASGAAPLSYQWKTDGGSGTLTNIPSYNASNLVVNTTGRQPGRYQYQVIVNNEFGSSTSAVASVTVLFANTNAVLTDLGSTTPTAGANDISQLNLASGANSPDGLNYYFDNATPPGQTFTTGSNPGGYTLSSAAISLGGNSGNLPAGGQTYLLRIYSVSGSTATLYAVYSSTPTNFVFANNTDWIRWSGFTLPLSANTVYAYSFGRISSGAGWDNLANVGGNPYAGGEVALIPANGGTITFGSSHSYDAVFDLGLSLAGYPIVSPPAFSPTNVIYAGTPVTISASVSGATSYQWETDGGGGGTMTNIPGATSPTLTVNTSPDGGLIINYALTASNGSGSTTGESAALTVNPGSAPILVQDIFPSAPDVFAGRTITFSASFGGTLPISYQWQVNTGSGAVNIANATNATLTLASVTAANAGTYNVLANNSVGGPVSSSMATLTVQPLPSSAYENTVLANNPLAYYPITEPSGSVIVYDMANGFNGTNQGNATFGVPGVPNPPFLGFGSETGFETTFSTTGSWATAPFGALGINNVTFTAWIYPNGTQTNWAGFVMSRTGGDEGGFGYNNEQMLDYTWNNGSTWSFVSGLVIPTNEWSFVAMVIQPTGATLYLYNTNGLLSTNNPIAHTPDVFGNNWHIGNDAAAADPTRTFNGVIDEVAIYAHSLTPAQIQQLYVVGATAVSGPIAISIQRSGSNLNLNWPAGTTLLEATNVMGPWTTISATPPYTVAPSRGQQFYRLKIQ